MEFQPLVNFDGVIEDVMDFFTDILKEYLLLIISVFFIWVALGCGMSFLQGRMERLKSEARIRESVRRSEERSIVCERSRTGRAAGRAMLAERMGWSRGGFERETERQLGGYSSDSDSEIRRILHRESENYGRNVQNIIDGSYVPSWKIKLRETLFSNSGI